MANKFTKFIYAMVTAAKRKIILLTTEELSNEEKKKKLDEHIISLIENTMSALGFNLVMKWFVRKFIVPNVDDLTQIVFNLLKAKVSGV